MNERYHLVIRNKTSGYQVSLTSYSMSHAECCVMKSKFSPEEQSRILFEPANETEFVDPDHGPIGNHEAVLMREIRQLRAEKELLMAKLSQLCGDA